VESEVPEPGYRRSWSGSPVASTLPFRSSSRRSVMRVQVGNWLIVEGLTDESPRRQGQIVAVDHADGSPPF
jgi:hypothetical protein